MATDNYRSEIVALQVLQEIRLLGNDNLQLGNVIMFYNGLNNNKNENGVSFIIKYSLLNLIKKLS